MTKATPEELSTFERSLGVALPSEYRAFLLHPPAELPRGGLRLGSGDDWRDWWDVRPPYMLRQRHPHELTLGSLVELYRNRPPGDGRIPTDAIPIAPCESLEEILLFVRGPRAGEVWIKEWFRLEEENIDDPESDLRFVAPSFSAFVAKLERKA